MLCKLSENLFYMTTLTSEFIQNYRIDYQDVTAHSDGEVNQGVILGEGPDADTLVWL